MGESALHWIIPIAGIAAILFALYLARDVLSRDTGTQAMQDVADTILEGAVAFVQRQYTTIAILAVVAARDHRRRHRARRDPEVADVPSLAGVPIGILTAIAFLVGAGCSMASGIIGMYDQRRVERPHRVRGAAQPRRGGPGRDARRRRLGLPRRRPVAARRLGHLHRCSRRSSATSPSTEAPFLIVGFGFGASFVALFAQLGGGIYTKAADVGSDLVGKVETGIPEDDPRNAGVIADLVGDNVGDCAGRGADLFESTAAENIGAMILGVARVPRSPPRSAGRTRRPGSSSRSSSAPSASSPRSSRCSSSAARRPRTR